MRELFKNCLRVKEEGGWLLPTRLTQAQEISSARREMFYWRAMACAGIAIAFRSAADKVTIEYDIRSNVRSHAYFDIVIDGILRATETLTESAATVTLEIPGAGEREVEIFLPHLAQMWIRRIEINAPHTPLPQKEKLWLFIGDSITQGMHAKHPSLTYPVLSARRMGCDFINMGIGASEFYAGDIGAPPREPDFITIALGTNDWKQAGNTDSLRESVRAFLSRLTDTFSCGKVLAILPTWRRDIGSVHSGMTFDELHVILREEYARYPFIDVIDGRLLVPHLEEFYGDGLHPNELGFLHYAMALTATDAVSAALGRGR